MSAQRQRQDDGTRAYRALQNRENRFEPEACAAVDGPTSRLYHTLDRRWILAVPITGEVKTNVRICEYIEITQHRAQEWCEAYNISWPFAGTYNIISDE